MRYYQMKMSLRSAGEEDVPYTLLLSACIEHFTTVYCVLCPSVVRLIGWPARDQQSPKDVNFIPRFGPGLTGMGDW